VDTKDRAYVMYGISSSRREKGNYCTAKWFRQLVVSLENRTSTNLNSVDSIR